MGGMRTLKTVLSGSFRRDPEGLRKAYEALIGAGCDVLSPAHLKFGTEQAGFVFLENQEGQEPKWIEDEHLQAITKADFVWLHCPDGYLGNSASFEIGFAQACGVPVFASVKPTDVTLGAYISIVESVREAAERLQNLPVRIPPALDAFQSYFAEVAIERGYAGESLRDCLLLTLEEMGELAHAIRKQEKMVRDHADRTHEVGHEIADVVLYLVHLANIAGIDLKQALVDKEVINRERFLGKSR